MSENLKKMFEGGVYIASTNKTMRLSQKRTHTHRERQYR